MSNTHLRRAGGLLLVAGSSPDAGRELTVAGADPPVAFAMEAVMTPRRKTLALLALGMLLGVAIWLFSPWVTGKSEPRDADAPIWSLSWLLVATLGGLTGHVRGACLPLGYALGQMLITVKSVFLGEFGALGWMFIGGYAAVAIAVTWVIVGVTALVMRLRRGWQSRRDRQ